LAEVGLTIKLQKQVIYIEINIMVKSPIWQGADQLAIYKCDQGVVLGTTLKHFQPVDRVGYQPRTLPLPGVLPFCSQLELSHVV